ncbi:hypothetical protein MMC25_007771 [Agyrium rufum]|nr:hypothetical protein [Agyrium rufum]
MAASNMRPMRALGVLFFQPFISVNACQCSPASVPRELLARPQQSFSFSTSPRAQNVSYKVAASFSAKGKRFSPKNNLMSFDAGQSSLRTRSKNSRPASGQDSFFVSSIGQTPNTAFGVADGVGGWAESGIDPADFAHGLCEYMSGEAQDFDIKSRQRLYAGYLLQKGYDLVERDGFIYAGGSTACLAVGGDDGALEVANLGDSGFAHFRPNAITFAPQFQTHAFNTPYQLSKIPESIRQRSRIFGTEPLQDLPQNAAISNHQVKHGDVLVLATDGVWDNMSASDMMKLINRYMSGFGAWEVGKDGANVSSELSSLVRKGGINQKNEDTIQAVLAVSIAGEAKAASENTRVDGPFAREFQKNRWRFGNENFHGGKVDDICVVVAVVVSS